MKYLQGVIKICLLSKNYQAKLIHSRLDCGTMKSRLYILHLNVFHITHHIFFCTHIINLLCPEYSVSSPDSGRFVYKLLDFLHLHSRNPRRLHRIASSSPDQGVGKRMDLLNHPAMQWRIQDFPEGGA